MSNVADDEVPSMDDEIFKFVLKVNSNNVETSDNWADQLRVIDLIENWLTRTDRRRTEIIVSQVFWTRGEERKKKILLLEEHHSLMYIVFSFKVNDLIFSLFLFLAPCAPIVTPQIVARWPTGGNSPGCHTCMSSSVRPVTWVVGDFDRVTKNRKLWARVSRFTE